MRLKIFCGALLFLLLDGIMLYAQPGEPCGGTDVDNPCPLDTWVIVLVVAAAIFGAVRLFNQQKSRQGQS